MPARLVLQAQGLVKSLHRNPTMQVSKRRLWKPRPQRSQGQKLACHLAYVGPVLSPPHTSESQHDGRAATPLGPHLAASSSSSSFTNCRGTCRESTLSAICSRIRRWLPSVVGKRYMRHMAPPNTEGRGDRDCVSRL